MSASMGGGGGEKETAWTTVDSEFEPRPESYRAKLTAHRELSLYISLVYVIFVFAGRAFMRSRQPPNLGRAMFVWNLVLTLFSLAGLIGIFPEFYSSLKNDGFFGSYCKIGDSYYTGVNGFWVYLFHLSKVAELGDTVFLVLRKRPVIFLHWYHHATVLIYLWFTYDSNVAPTRWGVMMNYFVHLIMYAYYAAQSMKIRLPGWLARTITSTQMLQFVFGEFFCAHSMILVITQGQGRGQTSCDTTPTAALVSSVLYLSYLILFAKFFYDSYLTDSKKLSKSTRKKSE